MRHFNFRKTLLRVGKAHNRWLKKAVIQNIFYSKYSVVFRKVLFRKCINDNKSKLRVHRKVACNCLLSSNWMTFLRCSKDKAELFPYLSNVIVKETHDKVLVSTVDEIVVINGAGLEIQPLMSCSIEEADEMFFAHVKHPSTKHIRIMIETVDSDVVVIAITNFRQLVS